MTLGLCLIGLTCIGWALAASAARPADGLTRRRDLDRRRRRLRAHPDRVNLLDVEHLLRSAAVGDDAVDRVMRRAAAHRLGARTMWRWADRHGSDRLVLAVDADLAEDTLLEHLDAGTAPDWSTLRVFADLNDDSLPASIPVQELLDPDSVPALEDLTFPDDLSDWTTTVAPSELGRFDSLPPIAGPGPAPYSTDWVRPGSESWSEPWSEPWSVSGSEAGAGPGPDARGPVSDDGDGWSAVA